MKRSLNAYADAAGAVTLGQGLVRVGASSSTVATLMIYGPIGPWSDSVKTADIVASIATITAPEIHVKLNSDGGHVSDGIAIYNALRSHPARVRVTVEGIAASIASMIAMAGTVVEMYDNTQMMLHAPSGGLFGNAAQMRAGADDLERYAEAMLVAYVAKTKKPADTIRPYLSDGKDHYFNAAEAVQLGLADVVLPLAAPQPDDTAAAAAVLTAYANASATSAACTAHLRRLITLQPLAFAKLGEHHQRAVLAHIEDPAMRDRLTALATAAVATAAATPPAAGAPAAPPAPAPAAPAAPVAALDPVAALAARNVEINQIFQPHLHRDGASSLLMQCLSEVSVTASQASNRLLALIGQHSPAVPVGGGAPVVSAGADQKDKECEAAVNALLARAAGVVTAEEAEKLRFNNPYAGYNLMRLAEARLLAHGHQVQRLSQQEICAMALRQVQAGGQGVSDFPVILENTLHKVVLRGYNRAAFTWRRFCDVGTLSDFRDHPQIVPGSFNSLLDVNEHGEYEDGYVGDGTKENLKAKRKGRILSLTPEALRSDDMSIFSTLPLMIGQAAGRSIERDVYALLALNSGLGPMMRDGNTLFHASHGNIGTGGVPSTTTFNEVSILMADQMDPSVEDYLDLVPAVFVGKPVHRAAATIANNAEFDATQAKPQQPNVTRGLMRDMVFSPRIAGTRWYAFASPDDGPVLRVGFLDGIQTPTLTQQVNFRSSGLEWKVEHAYGVGAVAFQGAVTNAGA